MGRRTEPLTGRVLYRNIDMRHLARRAGFPEPTAWVEALLDAGRPGFFLDRRHRDSYVRLAVVADGDTRGETIRRADAIVRHEFDLLGSGPTPLGDTIDWHLDFKSGRRWPLRHHAHLEYAELDLPSDVKVPWELSRFQYLTTLGRAYWFTNDERYAAEAARLMESWLLANPVGIGVNWACTMDVAIRAVNWLWGLFFFAGASAFPDSTTYRVIESLHQHGRFISRHLERSDVNGNHYVSDLVGLLLLGLFFGALREARMWAAACREALAAEVLAQVYSDGVDHEQSVAYHRLVAELFLTSALALRANSQPLPEEVEARICEMCHFTAAYTRPDGLSPLVGDADDGRLQLLGNQRLRDHRYLCALGAVLFKVPMLKAAAGHLPEELCWLCGPQVADGYSELPDAPPPTSRAFVAGGFFVMRSARDHIFIDCGDVGLRGRGGHGHNDALAFECFVDGAPLLTDCGAYLYTADWRQREHFRGTASHNTVAVDGAELAALGGKNGLWTIADDAQPCLVRWAVDGDLHRFVGRHIGYRRLADPVTVTRTITYDSNKKYIEVLDELDGTAEHDVSCTFTLDPEVRVASIDGARAVLVRSGTSPCVAEFTLPAGCALEHDAGWVSPSYGVRVSTSVLRWRGRTRLPSRFLTRLSWAPHQQGGSS